MDKGRWRKKEGEAENQLVLFMGQELSFCIFNRVHMKEYASDQSRILVTDLS